jgi:hypothetical protein
MKLLRGQAAQNVDQIDDPFLGKKMRTTYVVPHELGGRLFDPSPLLFARILFTNKHVKGTRERRLGAVFVGVCQRKIRTKRR